MILAFFHFVCILLIRCLQNTALFLHLGSCDPTDRYFKPIRPIQSDPPIHRSDPIRWIGQILRLRKMIKIENSMKINTTIKHLILGIGRGLRSDLADPLGWLRPRLRTRLRLRPAARPIRRAGYGRPFRFVFGLGFDLRSDSTDMLASASTSGPILRRPGSAWASDPTHLRGSPSNSSLPSFGVRLGSRPVDN